MRKVCVTPLFLIVVANVFFAQLLFAQHPYLHKSSSFSGEAKVYFDKNLQQVDSSSAQYYVIVLVQKGKDVWSLRPWWKKRHQLYGPIANETSTLSGAKGPFPLNGLVVWYKKDQSRPRVTEYYRDGRNAEKTTIYNRKGKVKEVYDYERTWNREPWGYYYEKMNKGNIERAGFEYFDTNRMKWESICTIGCYVTKDLRE
jgi:hypothetical protein